MARPQKKETDRRTHRLPHIRCTEKEGAAIRRNALASGMSVSDYIRFVALKGSTASVNDNTKNDFDNELIGQLHRVGNNLNQLTKRYHRDGKEPQGLQRLFPVLEQLLTHVFKQINLEK